MIIICCFLICNFDWDWLLYFQYVYYFAVL